MTEPRRSTVYDYSDLRLHPDGSRVYQKDSNRQLWLANKVVQTANKTWIATDAGGSMKVRKFRGRVKKKAVESEEGEEFNLDDAGGLDDEEQDESSRDEEGESGQKRKLKKKVDGRTIKRRKFLQDYSFLGSGDESKAASPKPAVPMEQPATTPLPHHDPFPFEPSADLLKYIHRFAAEFYTERGELLNISREFRKQRKARRLEKLTKAKLKREAKKDVSKQTKGKGKAAHNVSEEDEHSGPEKENDEDKESSSSSDGEGEDKNDDANTDSESDYLSENGSSKAGKSEGTSTKVQKGKTSTKKRLRWKGRKRAELLYKDMYKMFDGSALLALGMLVQEQIACLLMSQPPEGWEDEVKRTYGGYEASDDSNNADDGDGADGSLDEDHDEGRERGLQLQDAAEESNIGGALGANSQAAQPDDARGSEEPNGQNKPSTPQDDSDPEDVASPQSVRGLCSEDLDDDS